MSAEPKHFSPLRWIINQPYLLLSLTSLFWAGNIVLARFVAGHVPPLTLSSVRWIGAFILLWPFAKEHLRRDWPILRANLPLMLLLSATGFAFNNAISYMALQYTEALNALLIQSSAPLFVALWALLLFGVRLTWAQLGGIVISLAGVLTIILRGDLSALANNPLQQGRPDVCQRRAGIRALFSRHDQAPGDASPVADHFHHGLRLDHAGAVCMVGDAERLCAEGRSPDRGDVAYAVIFPSTLAYLCFNRGIALIGPNRAAPFLHLVPVFGSVMAIVLLGEQPRLFHVVGYALVLAGVVIASRQGSAKGMSCRRVGKAEGWARSAAR